MSDVYKIYGKVDCEYCEKAMRELSTSNLDYTYQNINESNKEEILKELTRLIGQQPKTVPQIFVDDRYIGGYNDLVEELGNENS